MINRWIVVLTVTGALPFALAVWLNVQQLTLLGADAAAWLWGYSAVIAAFLAGAQWGRSLQPPDLISLLASNGFALVVFALALWLRTNTGVVLLEIVFAGLLFVDRRQLRLGLINTDYWHLRIGVTALVCSLLAIYAFVSATP